MAVIMSLDEPRPRGTLLGERADRRRVHEGEHFFRCKTCDGWIDARDYVWVEDHSSATAARVCCGSVWPAPNVGRTGEAR
jgi:hypothetical protein